MYDLLIMDSGLHDPETPVLSPESSGTSHTVHLAIFPSPNVHLSMFPPHNVDLSMFSPQNVDFVFTAVLLDNRAFASYCFEVTL